MEKILVAGATGYLGKYIVQNLVERKFNTTVLVRNPAKFETFGIPVDRLVQAEVTNQSSLMNCCDGIDIVISTVGITKQSDGFSYMDVDFQANLNLLNEAKINGVRKFVYVSVLNGAKLKTLKICEAKEKFAEELKKSGLEYCIIRPNGFFSDMTEFYNMAKNGRIYLFGDGKFKSNPIHGEDLAQICVDAIGQEENEIDIGGPETFSQIEIATIAFEAVGKPVNITHIPEWVRRLVLRSAKLLLSANKFGPIEFFMNVMATEMTAPEYGVHTLTDFFDSLNNEQII